LAPKEWNRGSLHNRRTERGKSEGGRAAHREEEVEVPTLEKSQEHVADEDRRWAEGNRQRGQREESTEGKESLWLGLGLEAFF
jgi:hypothetical protein